MVVFRILLVSFGVAVLFFAIRFIATGEQRYLRWALRLLGGALVSGVVFFAVLLVSHLT